MKLLLLLLLLLSVTAPRPPVLAVSILAADQSELGAEVARAERGGARAIHVDVMDGHFVPNLAYGPDTVRALRAHTKMWIDVHLMVQDPDRIIPLFAQAGADDITVHVEACKDLPTTLRLIRSLHVSPGVAISPETPVSSIEPVLPLVDRVMLMSVHPGFGGQKFIPSTVEKLRQLRALAPHLRIEMDGGIDADNVGMLVHNGLDVAVAGSAVFDHHDAQARAHAMIEHMK